MVLGGGFTYHSDVVFQYLEPAWRLITGEGIIVWEQFYGARSQLIPSALALLMMTLQALGFDHPTALRTALEVVLCAVSLLIPWGMYAFARTAFDEHTGRVALVLGAGWWELVVLAGLPLSELLALPPLLWAFALAMDVRSVARARTLAFLVVVACAMRFQYGPVAIWLLALTLPRMEPDCRQHFFFALMAGIGLVGLFDLVTVGTPLYRSYLANIAFNAVFANEVVALGWNLPGYFHPVAVALSSGGLAVAACAAGLLHDRRDTRVRCALWLLIPITVILLTHAISPWKEYRHILIAVPLWLILLATAIRALWSRPLTTARIALTLVGAWFVATSAFGMLGKLPLQGAIQREASRPVPLHFIGSRDPRLSFANNLADDDGLVGLAEIGLNMTEGVGYVHLGRAVPIYAGHTIKVLRECGFLPRDYASHAIVPPDSQLPRGFTVTQTGDFGWMLAERTGGGATAPLALGPLWIVGTYGSTARRLFERDLKTDSQIAKAWQIWFAEDEGLFPLGRFRVHGHGSRNAQKSGLELPKDCRDFVGQ